MLRLPKAIDNHSTDQFYTKYNEPYYESIERLDNQPLLTGSSMRVRSGSMRMVHG